MQLIDTHCHLDAAEFAADRSGVIAEAVSAGVALMVVPAVEAGCFDAVRALAAAEPRCVSAFGIHPLYVEAAGEEALDALAGALRAGGAVAVGEIGLDFYVEGCDRALQERFFAEQLRLAREFGLPVLLHLRKAQDTVLKHLRRIGGAGGIAHAFNGSMQQANEFIRLGFRLGFGGAMTYERARRLRDLAARLPLDAIVLETDAPDMAPAWAAHSRNVPGHLARIAGMLAALRGVPIEEIAARTTANARAVLPRVGPAIDALAPAHRARPPRARGPHRDAESG
ncbi:MAG: DNAase [Rhodocyclales bacterium CG_4_9_14_3_um_filter_68_10]|nr:MAG: DNAase [Rhodocyclales bacterium CG_4_9_14_3_um_filter_68_10]